MGMLRTFSVYFCTALISQRLAWIYMSWPTILLSNAAYSGALAELLPVVVPQARTNTTSAQLRPCEHLKFLGLSFSSSLPVLSSKNILPSLPKHRKRKASSST
jgi:hypothetical protein